MHAVDSVDDKDYMIKQLQAAPTMKSPFASSTYFCNLLPSHLYTEIIDTWPPDKLFPNHVVRLPSRALGGLRALEPSPAWPAWPHRNAARTRSKAGVRTPP